MSKLEAQARQGEPLQIVSTSGAVQAPGRYPLLRDATVEKLIALSGGLKDSAYVDQAELRRLSDGSQGDLYATYIDIVLSESSPDADIPILSRDHLTVREIPNWTPNDSILLEGEVKFPGEYLIQRGETLSSVIARAGGVTDIADINAAIFTRDSVAQRESERMMEFAENIEAMFATRLLTEENSTRSMAEVSDVVEMLRNAKTSGRLLVDLSLALNGDRRFDLEISGGDVLRIPKKSNTITVVGEVHRPQTHTFVRDASLDDYLSLSAGTTLRADNRGIYVVKSNGAVRTLETNWWQFQESEDLIEPGDTIVVPVNIQYKDSLSSWREVTQILYQSLVSVAAVASL